MMDGWGVHGGYAVRWRSVAAAVMAVVVTRCWGKSREAAAQAGSGARARWGSRVVSGGARGVTVGDVA